jgi:hypothetical protein
LIADDGLVAGELSLFAEVAAGDPDGGLKEEQGADGMGDVVDEPIAAADVMELVEENVGGLGGLLRIKGVFGSGVAECGEEDKGLEPAYGSRGVDAGQDEELGVVDAEPGGEGVEEIGERDAGIEGEEKGTAQTGLTAFVEKERRDDEGDIAESENEDGCGDVRGEDFGDCPGGDVEGMGFEVGLEMRPGGLIGMRESCRLGAEVGYERDGIADGVERGAYEVGEPEGKAAGGGCGETHQQGDRREAEG